MRISKPQTSSPFSNILSEVIITQPRKIEPVIEIDTVILSEEALLQQQALGFPKYADTIYMEEYIAEDYYFI